MTYMWTLSALRTLIEKYKQRSKIKNTAAPPTAQIQIMLGLSSTIKKVTLETVIIIRKLLTYYGLDCVAIN